MAGGVSFVPDTTNFHDDNGHGTHVAGTIAALDNGAGVIGVSPRAEIYSVKVLDNDGSGTYSQLIQGIDWAIENNMNVISMSLGGTVKSSILHEAIQQATAKGILVIASAGNNGYGTETETYPALFPEVVSVGAINQTYKRASFSSTGAEIDLVAPGVDILSTTNNGGYVSLSGTSMAVPHVTGAAAALWSSNPNVTATDIKQKLYETATPLGNAREYGHGLINLAYAAGVINGPFVDIPEDSQPAEEKPVASDTSVIALDQRAMGIKNDLEYLSSLAKKSNQIGLMKEINKQYNDFLISSQQSRQLPDEFMEVEKNDSIERSQQMDQYYDSKKGEIIHLEETYREKIKDFSGVFQSEQINGQSDVTAAAETFEPNDSTTSAYPVTPGNIYTSYISTSTDWDFYKFTANIGGAVNIKLVPPTYKDYDIRVYDELGNTIAYGAAGKGITEDLNVQVTSNKTYYVRVHGFSGSYDTFNSYTLNLSVITTDLAFNTPLDIDLPVGASQVFKFVPPTSGVYSIYTGPYGEIGSSNDTVLELYSDANLITLLKSNDDANGTRFSEIKPTLTAGTPYYIKLKHAAPRAVHARLTATSDRPAFLIDTGVDVNLPAGSSQIYKFVPTASDYYRIFTDYYSGIASNGQSDTELFVYKDPTLTNLIAYSDDHNGTVFSQIAIDLTYGQPYYIKIAGFNGGSVNAKLNAVRPEINAAGPVIPESTLNDGSISATQYVFLSNATFATDMSTGVTVNNLPEGLGFFVTIVEDDILKVTFTGNAVRHSNTDDRNNVTISVSQDKIVGAVSDLTSNPFFFDFNDPASISTMLSVIPEANANDGSFSVSQVVSLKNGAFAADMSTGVTVNHLPEGVTTSVTRISDTQISLSFTGNALQHANADDLIVASVSIDQSKIIGATQNLVTETFMFDFFDSQSAQDYTYQYDRDNRLIAILFNGAVLYEFTYDENGNMLTKTRK